MYGVRSIRISKNLCYYFSRNSISSTYVTLTGLQPFQRQHNATNFPQRSLCKDRVSAVNIACRYKSNSEKNSYIQYEELLELLSNGKVKLIDVRDAKEIQDTGEFPGAYNIPLEDLKKALQMPAAEFQEMYKFDKPQTTDTNVVFASLKSVKSSAALEIAHKLGFNKTRQYVNGYEEWVVKQSGGRSKVVG